MTSSNKFDIYDDFNIYTIEDTDYAERDDEGEILEGKKSEEKALKHVLNDVKKIVRIVKTGTEPKFIYKTVKDSGGHGVGVMGYDTAKKLFETSTIQGLPKVKIGGKMRPMSLWKVIEDNMKTFRVKRMCFNSDEEDVFNTFSGYKYEPLDDEIFDASRIQLHLKHWKEVLCSGNDAQYNYLIKWCARLLKCPDARNRTGLVLLSKQGTGKNTFFTDHLLNIIGSEYACTESNANNIFGEFNKKIENKHLVVCNEMVDAENASNKQAISYDRLKSTMTDQTVSIRAMRTDAYDVDNVFNLIVVSNHGMPFRIEDEDRRLVFLDVSNKYAYIKDSIEIRNDPEMQKLAQERKTYFDALVKEKNKPLFLDNLYTYLLKQYDPEFDPENDKPLTKSKEIILERSVNPLEEFVENNIARLAAGNWESTQAYKDYKYFCNERGHKCISNIQGFVGELKRSYGIDTPRKQNGGVRKVYLCLNAEGEKKYAKLLTPQTNDEPEWKQLLRFKEFIPQDKMDAFESLLNDLKTQDIPTPDDIDYYN